MEEYLSIEIHNSLEWFSIILEIIKWNPYSKMVNQNSNFKMNSSIGEYKLLKINLQKNYKIFLINNLKDKILINLFSNSKNKVFLIARNISQKES